jgi:hypothetical protein
LFLSDLEDTGKVYIWGRLHRHSGDNAKQYFGFAIKMPGLKTREMLDRSIKEYLSGNTSSLFPNSFDSRVERNRGFRFS